MPCALYINATGLMQPHFQTVLYGLQLQKLFTPIGTMMVVVKMMWMVMMSMKVMIMMFMMMIVVLSSDLMQPSVALFVAL